MRFAKKLLAAALVLTMVLAMTPSMVMAEEAIIVTVDGVAVEFTDQLPVIVDERTLVPIRDVFEFMDFDVDWNPETATAYLERGGDLLIIVIGYYEFTLNGEVHVLDVAAQIIGERTMLPLRALLESIGYELYFDQATRTVIVTSPTVTVPEPEEPETEEPAEEEEYEAPPEEENGEANGEEAEEANGEEEVNGEENDEENGDDDYEANGDEDDAEGEEYENEENEENDDEE